MKSIAKFLLAVFSFAPAVAGAAPVATTAGSNLTGYNGSSGSAIGNQWNTATNPRANATPSSVKADYGNCNALMLRCATPKCVGGGCSSMDVAKTIATGCVNANATCKKHGDGLIEFIAGQLVADSVADANKQAAAAQAQAQAAAAQQNNQAVQQQMASMQQQMAQMQQQNNAQLASLQSALEESQRAAAAAQAQAATKSSAASGESVGVALTAAEENAVKSGVDTETIERAKITGQILTSMEGVDSALNQLKTNMRAAFKYGGCNEINGDNCEGPRRVKKFKELAMKFFEPYDALGTNLEDALIKAQSVGVDMSDIYMMLNGSCNRWAEYICTYTTTSSIKYCIKEKCSLPSYGDKISCEGAKGVWECDVYGTTSGGIPVYNKDAFQGTCDDSTHKSNGVAGLTKGGVQCATGQVIPPEDLVMCTINKIYNDDEGYAAIQEKLLNPDESSTGIIRVGCASNILNNSLFKRRNSARKGGVSIDILEYLITQDAPNSFGTYQNSGNTEYCTPLDTDSKNSACKNDITKYCAVDPDNDTRLRSATLSKSLGSTICCDQPNQTGSNPGVCNGSCDDETNSYIDPIYALCNVHAYNAKMESNPDKSEDTENMKRIIGLKTTVITQQMYKQFVSIESMIKRLKIQLEKSALKASLQAAGASSSSDDDEAGSGVNEFENCRSKFNKSDALSCLQSNYTKMSDYVGKGNVKTKIKKQMEDDCKVLELQGVKGNGFSCGDCQSNRLYNKQSMQNCLDMIMRGLSKLDGMVNNNQKSPGVIYIPGQASGI